MSHQSLLAGEPAPLEVMGGAARFSLASASVFVAGEPVALKTKNKAKTI